MGFSFVRLIDFVLSDLEVFLVFYLFKFVVLRSFLVKIFG